MNAIHQETENWYQEYYKKKGGNRNALSNPQVLFQFLAGQSAMIKALTKVTELIAKPTFDIKVLDVGCGGGGSLHLFSYFKFIEHNLYGIDILPERIEEARVIRERINFSINDATKLDFTDEIFDITFESTMFVQITDHTLASRISEEMVRVTKKGGYIILEDWRYSKPNNTTYKGVTKYRIKELFPNCEVINTYKGQLIPPIGRFLSKNIPSLYFLAQSLFPFLVGLKVTVLRKK